MRQIPAGRSNRANGVLARQAPYRVACSRRRLVLAVSLALAGSLAIGVADEAAAQAFPPVLQLSSLDGTNGFMLDGAAADNLSGRSVSAAGDINGDGIDDLIVGAPNAGSSSGRSYVVFGISDTVFSDGFEN